YFFNDIATTDTYTLSLHDALPIYSKIDRTTTGKGKVEDLTLAEIRKYHLKAPYGRISEETVPTFEEFLKVTKGKIMVDVDMKTRSEEHTSELQSRENLVCRLLLEK